MRTISVKERAKKLGVGMPTMYDWRKSYPEAWSALDKLDANSPVTQEMREIMSRQAMQNLGFFLTPDDPATWSASGAVSSRTASANGTTSTSASAQPTSQSRSTTTPSFIRPDGLGPEAEPEETFGGRGPGVLPPELVQQLAKEGALVTEDEIAAVHATSLDVDAGPGAAPYINETIDLTLHLKQSTLAPKVKENWDRCKRHFLAFWRCLNRIRSQQQQPSDVSSDDDVPIGRSDPEEEEILVSEQKLVTYLNCYVLHKNPRIGDEGVDTHIKAIVNLWETQTLQGRNHFPHPREGALLKAFTKALKQGRSALAAARLDDAWKHTLKDGYDPEEHERISRWYLKQEAEGGQEDEASWVRARFDFLMQHAIMGRSEDLRHAKLSSLYLYTTCKAVVVSIRHSKTNTEARREFGIAARHKNVETCPIGALALYLFQRFHLRNEFPDLSSRAVWYELNLLVDDEDRVWTLERAVTMLSDSIERRDRADESRANVQQVVMSSICALAGASSTLQSTHTLQHEQQQQTLQMLVRLLATNTLPALADPSPPVPHLSPSTAAPSSSTPLAPLPMPSHEYAAAASIASDTERPSPSFVPPPMRAASSVSAVPSASPAPIFLPRTILCIAAKVNTVSQLAVEWHAGKDGYMGVFARLEAKDEALDAKGAAARKQICRWRRVVGVLEELESQSGWSRDAAARAMDTQLKKNKHGLRTLANNIAKDDARAAWMALLVAATS
ncbi:unnamed protein product [Tilletia laevis]|nr:unnamed protein product [Tilletia laevis]